MLKLGHKLWQRGRDLLPFAGFRFDRPLILLQSDDWGRVGLRDREGLEELRAAGIGIGERVYDFYTFETAEDVNALAAALKRHRDSVGRSPCLQMNFIVGNLNFAPMAEDALQQIHFLPLA